MWLCYAKFLLLLPILVNLVVCRYMEIGSPVLDCVRIRNVETRVLVYGTGYFHSDDNQRYVGTWNYDGTPFNSAFKVERILKYKEPLYYLRMINTQEYLIGGPFTTTSKSRIPIFSYHKKVNTTLDPEGIFGFEKARDKRGALNGAWYIKAVHFEHYVIGSRTEADPPKGDTTFHLLQMDRRYQPELTTEHQFYLEQC
uniref:Putative conserved secreted protein n=1 Tax=Culex tarsalis TaxID=7177 RepID=A0A1Q3G033_CULTA